MVMPLHFILQVPGMQTLNTNGTSNANDNVWAGKTEKKVIT
jgi:hypothetical protein